MIVSILYSGCICSQCLPGCHLSQLLSNRCTSHTMQRLRTWRPPPQRLALIKSLQVIGFFVENQDVSQVWILEHTRGNFDQNNYRMFILLLSLPSRSDYCWRTLGRIMRKRGTDHQKVGGANLLYSFCNFVCVQLSECW